MFKSVDELKSFIVWAKAEGIQQLKVSDVEVLFYPTALLESVGIKSSEEMPNDSSTSLVDSDPEATKDEEDLLYWSSR